MTVLLGKIVSVWCSLLTSWCWVVSSIIVQTSVWGLHHIDSVDVLFNYE